jgi:hypothetical protein
MEKLTAVQWLALRYHQRQGYLSQDDIAEAKAMMKEQMYQVWKTSEEWSDGKLLDSKKSFEEYYNETYNK